MRPTYQELLAAVDRMAEAAAIVGRDKALELANNIAAALSDGEADPYQVAVEAIMTRVRNGRLSVGCVSDLAKDMARAWRGHRG